MGEEDEILPMAVTCRERKNGKVWHMGEEDEILPMAVTCRERKNGKV